MTKALYIHFPFCGSKCHYCDFYSSAGTSVESRARYFKALAIEAATIADKLNGPLDSLYIGGGTPSLAEPAEFFEALKPLQLGDRLDKNTEFTVEVNPVSITSPKLKGWLAGGANRISIGIQSLRPELLNWLGRKHDPAAALAALRMIFDSGFSNVSADLLCGVPGLTSGMLREDLQKLLALPITHLSCYLLTLTSEHPLFTRLPQEDEQQAQLLTAHRTITETGFRHYEISNYCRPGFESRHNLTYWTKKPYLALGPSAHSFDGARRWNNVGDTNEYCERLERGISPIEQLEVLTPEQETLESWMLALRMDSGFPEDWIDAGRRHKCEELIARGLLERHPRLDRRLHLTPLGLTVSDQVIRELC